MNAVRYSLDDNWQFRGEGNQNLVVALRQRELIVRFRKGTKETTSYNEQELEKSYLLESQYHFLLMVPLLKEYFSVPLIINLPHSQVEELKTSLLAYRAEARKHKEIISNIAELYPDYTVSFNHSRIVRSGNTMNIESSKTEIMDYIQRLFCTSPKTFIGDLIKESYLGQDVTNMVTRMFNLINGKPVSMESKEEAVFCFEIKPKQAWFHPSDRKIHKCIYCMHQYFKLQEKKIDKISKYCPLDLFSGDLNRMKYAVKNLLLSPQNNFKIFKNGKLLFGNDIHNEDCISLLKDFFSCSLDNLDNEDRLINEFCCFISNALLSQIENSKEYMKEITLIPFERNFSCNVDLKIIEKINENFVPCNWNFDYLPKGCILSRILEMQMLDREGIEASYECYLSRKDSDFSYVEKVASLSIIGDRMIKFPPFSIAECYAVSSAAKDCSIFITVKMLGNKNVIGGNWRIFDSKVFNRTFRYIISVADIGPKAISSVAKHWKRNVDIHNACLHFSLSQKQI